MCRLFVNYSKACTGPRIELVSIIGAARLPRMPQSRDRTIRPLDQSLTPNMSDHPDDLETRAPSLPSHAVRVVRDFFL